MTTLLFLFTIVLVAINSPAVCTAKRIGAKDFTANRQLESYFNTADLNEVSLCGCNSCYDRGVSGYATRTGDETCAQRIRGLIAGDQQYSEEAACEQIAKHDFQDECGSICDPDLCDGRDELQSKADIPKPQKTFCGCKNCTTSIWVSMAGQYSCGARISYVSDFQGKSELDACRKVAGEEFFDICGACDPDTCEKADQQETSTEVYDNVLDDHEKDDKPENHGINRAPLTPDFPLYCYPSYSERVRYNNVWGKYTVEVKESDSPCGPSDNIFSRRAVQISNDELTLQFKKVGNQWEGSEVRVLLPLEEMPFHYGDYSFSVKSIQVIDSTTGVIVDTVLPVSIILGLFSWDATEDYASHENYNHEVDVEVARWNIDDLADVQFLVQPPGDPHKYRFFSGEGDTYSQAPHRYSFNWKPAEIDWSSSAGGGHTFTYGSQDALNAMQPDYTQCMPADVEIRMNLWNLFGSSTPRGMEDSYIVEVVIDDFQFAPSGLTGLPENGVCTKDCQCQSQKCERNKCTPSGMTHSSVASYGDDPKPFPQSQPNNNTADALKPNGSKSSEVAEANKGDGGLSKAGKVLLIMFFLLLATVIVVAVVRRRRAEKNVARMSTFSDKVRITTYSEDNPKKKVVVECWETDSENLSSFEMSLKRGIVK